jgi:hypothetical protein
MWYLMFAFSVLLIILNKRESKNLATDFDKSERAKAIKVYRILYVLVGIFFASISLYKIVKNLSNF